MSRGKCNFCEEEINDSPHVVNKEGKEELYHHTCSLVIRVIEKYPERVRKTLEKLNK